ncbi:hypothetical protein EJ03DRAFT_149046 [Teratosphaeria nubilosa]|uniref:Uncharacterized protein n=1 Tax=Teratosphaeria nubilosa TaxID=161662 RepID=A0A6G1L5D7_9PEZI|nr:hypothetical protein EJ03DRAFT_149046 [Teratosphaeria nubilosa]
MSSKRLGKRRAADEHAVRIKQEFRASPTHSSNGTLPPEQPPPSIPDDHFLPSSNATRSTHASHNHLIHAQTRLHSRQADGRESMTIEAFLDSSDHEDILLLQHCSPASGRYQDFISAFVDRALFRGQDPNKSLPSALEYFDLIGTELRKADVDPERVHTAREAMLCLWQERLAAMAGATGERRYVSDPETRTALTPASIAFSHHTRATRNAC